MLKTVVAFVDGENLVCRYQDMLRGGRSPRAGVVHEQDAFVWSSELTLWTDMDLIRVSYYTSVVGADDTVAKVERLISTTRFRSQGRSAGVGYSGHAQIIPRVHKKPAKSNKTKVVDVEITMDVMRAALTMPIDGIFLLTGDGDYLPLVREVSRSTSKQIYLGAFSSGLAEGLRNCVEAFVDLDPLFFGPVAV